MNHLYLEFTFLIVWKGSLYPLRWEEVNVVSGCLPSRALIPHPQGKKKVENGQGDHSLI